MLTLKVILLSYMIHKNEEGKVFSYYLWLIENVHEMIHT